MKNLGNLLSWLSGWKWDTLVREETLVASELPTLVAFKEPATGEGMVQGLWMLLRLLFC